MIRRTSMMLIFLGLAASAECAQDDVMDKIRLLEQQIQELKLLKEQQVESRVKFDDCMKAVDREKFCSCVSDNLPREVSFEQYVHIQVTPREKLGYETMTAEQKKVVDRTSAVREKCIEKGFFK